MAGTLFLAGPAKCQSALERVLAKAEVVGLLANASQSGFGPLPVRIDARITTLLDGISVSAITTDAMNATPSYLHLGSIGSVALGATNAGDVIVAVSVGSATALGPGKLPLNSGIAGFPAASVMLLGDNMASEIGHDLIQVEDRVATSYDATAKLWQTGTQTGAPTAVMNLAANASDVNARVLTQVNAAVLDAKEMTATALGAVNIGLASVIGDRSGVDGSR